MRLVAAAGRAAGRASPSCPTDVDSLLGDDTVALRGPWDTDDLVQIGPSADDLGQGLRATTSTSRATRSTPGAPTRSGPDALTHGSRPDDLRPGRHRGGPRRGWPCSTGSTTRSTTSTTSTRATGRWSSSSSPRPTRRPRSSRSPPGSATASTRASRSPTGATSSSRSSTAPTRSCTPPPGRTPTTTTPPSSSAARASRASAATTPAARAPTLRPAVALVPVRPRRRRRRAYPWLDYTGRWGQREASFYNGPTGPNTKDQWTAPLTVDRRRGRRHRYAVPASGLFGTQATSAFCGIVATGSDALRLAMSNPARAVLVLVGAAAGRRLAGAPHDVATLRAAAPGPAPHTGQVLVVGVADVPAAGSPSSSGSAPPSPSRRSFRAWPRVAHVLVASRWAAISTGLRRARRRRQPGPRRPRPDHPRRSARRPSMVAVREIDAGRPVGSSARTPAPCAAGARCCSPAAARRRPARVPLHRRAHPGRARRALVARPAHHCPLSCLEGSLGWPAVRRSAHLVRPRWVKVVVLVALTTGAALADRAAARHRPHPRHLPAVRGEQRGRRASSTPCSCPSWRSPTSTSTPTPSCARRSSPSREREVELPAEATLPVMGAVTGEERAQPGPDRRGSSRGRTATPSPGPPCASPASCSPSTSATASSAWRVRRSCPSSP